MNFDPALIEPNQCYKLMVSAITPRPIAWVSTLSTSGVLNLAPYSFFTVASCNPPVLAVTQVNPRDRWAKDTLTNLSQTKECVINIVSEELAQIMNASCANYASDTSEFEALGIESTPSQGVAVAGVRAAKVRFECTLREVLVVSSLPSGGHLMLLDVVNIYVDESVLIDDQIAPELLATVGKMGGDFYTTTKDLFAMPRPLIK